MIKHKIKIGLVSLALFALAGPSQAQLIEFMADISQEWNENFLLFPTGGTGSSATGLLTFDYDTDLNLLSNVNVSITGITTADLSTYVPGRAHIHPSLNGIQMINIGNMGFVDVPGGMEIVGGSATITDADETEILSGASWINIHTSAFPNGEIAGVVTALVPLPPALWLFGSGLMGLMGYSTARKSV